MMTTAQIETILASLSVGAVVQVTDNAGEVRSLYEGRVQSKTQKGPFGRWQVTFEDGRRVWRFCMAGEDPPEGRYYLSDGGGHVEHLRVVEPSRADLLS